jgi:16S rRNA (cytosine1402-N4)-methyltransferase
MGIGMNGPEDPGDRSTPLHVPVLLETTLELLAPSLDRDAPSTVVDATLGLGGHAEALLERFPRTTLIGVDRDPDALRRSGERLSRFGDRFQPAHAVYDGIPEVLDDLGVQEVEGVLFDLGVSSMQLDQDDRGFSYSRDVPLDMRMDPGEPRTAQVIVNEYDPRDLSRIFRIYGEERLADRYARAIAQAREVTPIRGSAELVAVLEAATPAALKGRGHVGKRVFQALRIEVNRELEVLERAVPAALDRISTGGRIVVLSYHSLEDRIVKRALAARTVSTAPRGLPIETDETAPTFRMLTRGAPKAAEREVERNPRAASVRLRAAERIRGDHRTA